MKLYAFDRDGTVTISDGPIPLIWIKYLASRNNCIVYAIGNQKLRQEANIPGISGMERRDRLRTLRKRHPEADEYIVADDANLNDMEAEGWTYYTPQQFVDVYESYFAPLKGKLYSLINKKQED